jgi:hypothetical protein
LANNQININLDEKKEIETSSFSNKKLENDKIAYFDEQIEFDNIKIIFENYYKYEELCEIIKKNKLFYFKYEKLIYEEILKIKKILNEETFDKFIKIFISIFTNIKNHNDDKYKRIKKEKISNIFNDQINNFIILFFDESENEYFLKKIIKINDISSYIIIFESIKHLFLFGDNENKNKKEMIDYVEDYVDKEKLNYNSDCIKIYEFFKQYVPLYFKPNCPSVLLYLLKPTIINFDFTYTQFFFIHVIRSSLCFDYLYTYPPMVDVFLISSDFIIYYLNAIANEFF